MFAIITFSSCGDDGKKDKDRDRDSETDRDRDSETNQHARDLCDCLDDIGLNELSLSDFQDSRFMNDMERKAEEKLPPCVLKIAKNMEADLEDLNKSERVEYTQSFIKDCIDSDCAENLIRLIPFDMMGMFVGKAEEEMERDKRYRGDGAHPESVPYVDNAADHWESEEAMCEGGENCESDACEGGEACGGACEGGEAVEEEWPDSAGYYH